MRRTLHIGHWRKFLDAIDDKMQTCGDGHKKEGLSIMSASRENDGQHRSFGPATNNGQRNVRGSAGDVGQPGGGEQNQGVVPAGRADSDISTTRGAAGAPRPGPRK